MFAALLAVKTFFMCQENPNDCTGTARLYSESPGKRKRRGVLFQGLPGTGPGPAVRLYMSQMVCRATTERGWWRLVEMGGVNAINYCENTKQRKQLNGTDTADRAKAAAQTLRRTERPARCHRGLVVVAGDAWFRLQSVFFEQGFRDLQECGKHVSVKRRAGDGSKRKRQRPTVLSGAMSRPRLKNAGPRPFRLASFHPIRLPRDPLDPNAARRTPAVGEASGRRGGRASPPEESAEVTKSVLLDRSLSGAPAPPVCLPPESQSLSLSQPNLQGFIHTTSD
ncbi:hypothetical protein AAFF_G00329390 [Aldrovandia affinis]|uniref:Uncharacterized protein n=1 Tax=Aldrovandia affinis TaxID=143900 RepID=A0AAD7SMP2_9TELE|nr:hypothetical protein AAFF_G00329390 [Aldrovandia affinis]